MKMWLCMKRSLNVTELFKKKFEDRRAKIAEADRAIQDADRLAEENAVKITDLSKLAKV